MSAITEICLSSRLESRLEEALAKTQAAIVAIRAIQRARRKIKGGRP